MMILAGVLGGIGASSLQQPEPVNYWTANLLTKHMN
jgi:hypothetical protein